MTSWTYVLFAVTSLVAFFTPAALDRAYVQRVGQYHDRWNSIAILGSRTTAAVITDRQLAVGQGGWTTGLRAEDMYPNRHNYNGNGTFITGAISLHPRDAVLLSGLQLQPVESEICRKADVDSLQKDHLEMRSWCSQHGLNARYENIKLDGMPVQSDLVAVEWCTGFDSDADRDWMNQENGHTTTVIFRIWATFAPEYIIAPHTPTLGTPLSSGIRTALSSLS
jgi:hypothetical protein